LSAEHCGLVVGYYGASKYAVRSTHLQLGRNEQLKNLVLKPTPQSVMANRVLDAGGVPIEEAQVTLLKLAHSRGGSRWVEVESATTSDHGAYRCARLPAGRYLVSAKSPEWTGRRLPQAWKADT
jgi:hypothetical protein